jgi:hypothetical protein
MLRALTAVLFVSLFAGLTGCGHVDAAPMTVDGLIHYFWDHYSTGSDEEIAMGVRSLHTNGHADKLGDAQGGSFSHPTADELGIVGLQDHDPKKARGMYVFDVIHCSLDQVEKIVAALDQDKLYTGVYDSYDRKYTSDFDTYMSRKSPTLTWDVDIAATILGAHYTESLHGGLRRVEPIDTMATPFGPTLMARAYMPSPAQFPGSGKTWNQDYQIEVYYERAMGETVHLYGIWRQMDLGTFLNLNTDNDEVVSTIVGHLVDWDNQTVALCKAGKP